MLALVVLAPIVAGLTACANHAAPAIPEGAERPINVGRMVRPTTEKGPAARAFPLAETAAVAIPDAEVSPRVARLEKEIETLRSTLAAQEARLKEQALNDARNRVAAQQRRAEEEAKQAQAKADAIRERNQSLLANRLPDPSPIPGAASAPVAPPVMPPSQPVPDTRATAAPTPALVQEKTWDAPARKAAGVPAGQWLVGERASLRAVVEVWASEAGYAVDWQSRQDYSISDAIRARSFAGTLQTALMQLAAAYGDSIRPLSMTFTKDKGGKPLLRVVDA